MFDPISPTYPHRTAREQLARSLGTLFATYLCTPYSPRLGAFAISSHPSVYVALLGRHRARCLTVRLSMPPVRAVRETFASYGSRQRDIMGKVHFANSTERSPWSACAFAGYLCTVSRPSPSGPSPCT